MYIYIYTYIVYISEKHDHILGDWRVNQFGKHHGFPSVSALCIVSPQDECHMNIYEPWLIN